MRQSCDNLFNQDESNLKCMFFVYVDREKRLDL